MATIELARAAISHAHAAAGIAKGDNSARLPRRGRGGRMETPAADLARAAVDLAIIGVMADGALRRSESAALTWGDVAFWPDGTARIIIQKGKNQPEPATVAVTESTARALCEIQPDGADPATPARHWPTGCELWPGPPAWAKTSPGHSGRIGMARRMVAAGAPTAVVQHQGRWTAR